MKMWKPVQGLLKDSLGLRNFKFYDCHGNIFTWRWIHRVVWWPKPLKNCWNVSKPHKALLKHSWGPPKLRVWWGPQRLVCMTWTNWKILSQESIVAGPCLVKVLQNHPGGLGGRAPGSGGALALPTAPPKTTKKSWPVQTSLQTSVRTSIRTSVRTSVWTSGGHWLN